MYVNGLRHGQTWTSMVSDMDQHGLRHGQSGPQQICQPLQWTNMGTNMAKMALSKNCQHHARTSHETIQSSSTQSTSYNANLYSRLQLTSDSSALSSLLVQAALYFTEHVDYTIWLAMWTSTWLCIHNIYYILWFMYLHMIPYISYMKKCTICIHLYIISLIIYIGLFIWLDFIYIWCI